MNKFKLVRILMFCFAVFERHEVHPNVVGTQEEIFITAYRNYSNSFPKLYRLLRYKSLTVKLNLSAKCLLTIIYTKHFSMIPCSSTANSSHIGVGGKKNKTKAVVSFPFPYNYGTVIVHEVQQAVRLTKELTRVKKTKEQVNQWKCLNISSFILRGEKSEKERTRGLGAAFWNFDDQCVL